MPPLISHLDRHANSTIGAEIENQHRVAHHSRPPVEKDDVQAPKVVEMISSRFVPRGKVRQRAVFEVADVFDGDHVAVADRPRQNGHGRFPLAVVTWLQLKPPTKERRQDAKQRNERLPHRLPQDKCRRNSDDPGNRDQPAPSEAAAQIAVNCAGHPNGDAGGRRQCQGVPNCFNDSVHNRCSLSPAGFAAGCRPKSREQPSKREYRSLDHALDNRSGASIMAEEHNVRKPSSDRFADR